MREQLLEYVNGLSVADVREQLVLAFLMMECCCKVLDGERVEPVVMEDNGFSSDLELYYKCLKVKGL